MKNTSGRRKIPIKTSIALFLCATIGIATMTRAAAPTVLPPQQHQVTGTVTDQNGLSIPGVAVRVKNSSTGTVTNPDGVYTISAAPDATLIFTYLGFQTMEVPVDSRNEINIRLEEDVTALGEVEINAGYYYTTRREGTGNISKVTAEEIELQPVLSPIEALQGRMAGVEISSTSNHAGAATTIRIRGRNSVRDDGNFPLYIIDGVPINSTPIETNSIIQSGLDPLNTIDITNIKSIEVLKDADATAIYGSRGANGVVLITTKDGLQEKTKLEARVYTGATTVPNRLNLLNTEQYLHIRRQAFENDGTDPSDQNAYDLTKWDQTRYTDWQDYFFGHTSNTTQVNVATSGGNEKTYFRLGGSYRQQGTVYLGDSEYQKITGNLTLKHSSSNERLDLQLALNYGIDNNDLAGALLLDHHAFNLPPNAPSIFLENGNLNWDDWTEVGLVNPLEGYFFNESQTNNLVTSLGATYELLDGLKVRSNMGYTYLNSNGLSKIPKSSYNPANWATTENSSSHLQNVRKSWIFEPQLTYEWTHKKSQLDALIGGTFQESQGSSTRFQGQGYVSEPLIGNLSAADRILNGNSQNSKYRYSAVFGRLGFNWSKKYFLNLTGRRDGSSRFGPGKKIANFWAIGGAWIFTERPENTFLSFGKIRGSYGTTGNDQIGDYGYLDAYEATKGPGGLYPTQLSNPDYSWEENKKLEAAVDLAFLKDQLNIGVSWYRNRSSNQLVGYSLPYLTGFSSIQANFPATVQNTGLEIVLSSRNFQSKNFSWETSFNISFPKNKLISFPDIEQSSYANRYRVGHPLNISLLYQYGGIDSETGLYIINDVNEDGRLSHEDRVEIQDFGKQYFGGLINNIRYKNFSLRFLLDFVKQEGTFHFFNTGGLGNQHVRVLEAFDPNSELQAISVSTAARNAYSDALLSTLPVVDASFIRIKSISASYSLPRKVLNVLNLDAANIFINGHNLITLTSYKGMDPENPQIGMTFTGLRTISGGLSLNL